MNYGNLKFKNVYFINDENDNNNNILQFIFTQYAHVQFINCVFNKIMFTINITNNATVSFQ